ncbi:MAG: hypothetical protein HQM16_10305 [Deltaproteobacteria bacterium]|nr:hypothetical protein [Deltaproteobacteria bacterium]
MDNDITQPWGPYKDCLSEDGNCSNRNLDLSLIAPALGLSVHDQYRTGFGMRVSIPITDTVDLGASYTYHPVPHDKIFNGHHLDLFAGFPEKFDWGNWRIGAFVEIPNFTSLNELVYNYRTGSAGIFTGIDLTLVSLTRTLDLNLNLDVGISSQFDTFKLETFFTGALELKWTL